MINNWIYNWARNNWKTSKNQSVENLDLVKTIYKYLTKNFSVCQVKKVTGHVGIEGNEVADALATHNKAKFMKIAQEQQLIINPEFDF